MNLILSESDPKPALLRLQALNFLQQIHPYLSINAEIIEKMVKILKTPIDPIWQLSSYNGTSRINIIMAYITWFMNLKHSPRLIGKRLRTPAIVTESSIQAQQSLKVIHKYVNKKPSEITEYFDTLSPYVLFILYHSIDDPRITGLIDQYISHWKKVKPFTSGEDLQKLGITPGPIYKKILSRLRKAWLDEEIRSVEHENILLDEVITSIKENGK